MDLHEALKKKYYAVWYSKIIWHWLEEQKTGIQPVWWAKYENTSETRRISALR